MNENLFVSKLAGKIVWVQDGLYFRFEPNLLPVKYTPSNRVLQQLSRTASVLGELRGRTKDFSNQEIALVRHMFTIKEATLSSEIEGTRSTIGDVLRGKKIEEKDPEKRLDNEEINNYVRAIELALKRDANITETLLKELHVILLKGVRGSAKSPGEYKINQNGVGNREDTLDIAKFVPASPQTTPGLMANLVEFINSTEFEALYKMAIAHYQFETIHPFRDGNGRLGRLIIMLQMCREQLLEHPLLYISEYFNRNRDTYTEALFNVSSKGDIENWVLFFLKALEFQANQSLKLLNQLLTYKSELQDTMHKLSKSPNMHILIDSLFKQPFFEVNDVKKSLDISQPAAWILIKKLEKMGIINEVKKIKRRSKLYVASKIIAITEGRT